jgi:hypothetical protein
MDLSKEEIEGFVEQMKESIFESHSEAGGLVQGEIKESVFKLLYDNIDKGIPINNLDFQKMLISITEKLTGFLTEEIEDLPEKLAATFSFDLVSQVITTLISKIDIANDGESNDDGDSEHDPMFG